MRAIRADAESKRREQQSQSGRAGSTRTGSRSKTQEVFMSGALGPKKASPDLMEEVNDQNNPQRIQKESISFMDEPDIVPSSMQSEEARLPILLPHLAGPSTIQKPMAQRATMPSANWKTQSTPRLDSSILGNFKRRPRQPSILGIGRQDASSVLSSLSGGENDPFFDELDDFDPAVVTPLIRSKRVIRDQPLRLASSPPTSNNLKRKRGSDDPSRILVQRSPSITNQNVSRFLGSSPEQFYHEGGEVELPQLKRNIVTTSRTSNTSSPNVWSDTMAPPKSSPSDRSIDLAVLEVKTQRRIMKRKAPTSAKKANPKTRSQGTRALQPISTAQLQNLLPSRRSRHASKPEDSLDGTNMDLEDEDEASFVPTRRIRASSKQPKTPVKKSVASKSGPKSNLRDKTNTKSVKTPGSALSKSKPRPGLATNPKPVVKRYGYGSRAVSGQENEGVYSLPPTQDDLQDISNSTIADLDFQAKSELDAIVRKFAEVDEWEMEFEDVEESSGSGSGLLLG